MTPEQTGFLIGTIIGGALAGSICGLLPLGIGRWKNRQMLGTAGLITCIVSGVLFGAILAAPVAIVFALVMIVLGKPAAVE